MNKLILLRHGQSQWNLENRFTGWKDVPLTDQGLKEATKAGLLLNNGASKFRVSSSNSLTGDSMEPPSTSVSFLLLIIICCNSCTLFSRESIRLLYILRTIKNVYPMRNSRTTPITIWFGLYKVGMI